jgi:hypothetical protein
MNKEYTEFEGFSFDSRTPAPVMRELSRAYRHGYRVRVYYGDQLTGKSWAEEFDIMGTIGRSCGRVKIPLMINSARSNGGPGLLDHCIVAIQLTSTKQFLYKCPNFDPGEFVQVPAISPGYVDAVSHNGAIHAQFKKPGQAARYIQFMTGARMAK